MKGRCRKDGSKIENTHWWKFENDKKWWHTHTTHRNENKLKMDGTHFSILFLWQQLAKLKIFFDEIIWMSHICAESTCNFVNMKIFCKDNLAACDPIPFWFLMSPDQIFVTFTKRVWRFSFFFEQKVKNASIWMFFANILNV